MKMDEISSDPRDAIFMVSDLRKDLGRHTGRSAVYVLIASALKLVVTIVTTSILARLVPPEQQGLVAVAMPAVLLAAGLSEFGLAQAVIQREVVTHAQVSMLFWMNLALGVVLSTLVALLGPLAERFYGTPGVPVFFLALAPYVLFTVLSTQYVAILRRQMRIRTIEVRGMIALLVSSILTIGAALLGWGPWALVVQLVAMQGLTFLLLVSAVRWRPSLLGIRFSTVRDSLAFGGFLALDRLLNEVANGVYLAMVGRSFSEAVAALYYRSDGFAQMPARRITAPLNGVFISALSRLNGEPRAFQAMYARQLSRANLIILPVGMLLFLCGDGIVLVLLGKDWSAAGPILSYMGLVAAMAQTTSSLTAAMVASGRSREIFLLRLATVGLQLAALFVSIPYGIVAVVAVRAFVLIALALPLTAFAAVRSTPLTFDSLVRSVGTELGFASILFASGLALRWLLPLDPLPGLFATGGLIAACVALRILLDDGLRTDVLRALIHRRG